MGCRALTLLLGLGALLTVRGATAAADPAVVELGRRVYEANCAICHGVNGDGQGEAASRFQTRPRDFTTGRYKFRSTGSGQLPTDADLIRSVVSGLPGTSMVPQDHLNDAEVRAVVEFVKGLSPRFAAASPRKPLPVLAAPAMGSEALARGRAVYEKGECAECHGREGRGDGPSAKDLAVKPTDLTAQPLKSGPTPRDILRTVLTGLDGTPMPSYHLVLDDGELWDLAYYVHSLGSVSRMGEDERLGWDVERRHPGIRK